MARKCTICAHPSRAPIDQALADGTSLRTLAARFHVVTTSLARHAKRHIPLQLTAAREARELQDVDDATTLLLELQTTKGRVLGIMDSWDAMPKGQRLATIPVFFGAVRAHVHIAELLLKVELARAKEPTDLAGSVEWMAVHGALMAALEPYPAARKAVVKAFSGPLVEEPPLSPAMQALLDDVYGKPVETPSRAWLKRTPAAGTPKGQG